MKMYFCCGIAKIIIIKINQKEEKEEILKRFSKKVDLKIYNIMYTEGYIVLNIKNEILEQNFYEFIYEQSKNFNFNAKNLIQREIQNIKNKKYDMLMKTIKSKNTKVLEFTRGNEYSNDISYLDEEGKNTIFCDIISFISVESIFYKNYNEIFTYLRNCIINTSNNIIKTAIVITIVRK